MKYAWIASHLDQFDLQLMCGALSVKKSSYFSWVQLDHLERERTVHEEEKNIEDAFFFLKENAGERDIRGYLLHEKGIQISRRKIGRIFKKLDLKVKTQKSFKKQSSTPANDPRIKPIDYCVFTHIGICFV